MLRARTPINTPSATQTWWLGGHIPSYICMHNKQRQAHLLHAQRAFHDAHSKQAGSNTHPALFAFHERTPHRTVPHRTAPTLRILASANWTRQISRLHRRPYSPQSLSSESRRSFSYGRLGVLKVFRSALIEKKTRQPGGADPKERTTEMRNERRRVHSVVCD